MSRVPNSVRRFVARRERRAIEKSRKFDVDWYGVESGEAFATAGEAIAHYQQIGARKGLAPHPLFSPASTEPRRGWTPFGTAVAEGVELPDLDPTLADTWRAVMAERGARMRLIPPPDSATLPADHVLLKSPRPRESSATRVSIVLPTWNRADQTLRAISSVRSQDWRHWELLVVDDGSDDDTVAKVSAIASKDPRVKLIQRLHEGVVAARNAALDAATGGYIAFLDSDNRWQKNFLSIMVGQMVARDLPAAFCTLQIARDGGPVYRHAPTSRELLGVRNQIDMNVLVVRADVMREVGHFDPSLRRAVDWDLAIRIADIAPITHIPFVGAVIDRDLTGADRISVAEADMWPNVVRLRHLIDWDAERAKERDPELYSIVIPLGSRTVEQLEVVAETFAGRRHEIVLVDCKAPRSWLMDVLPFVAANENVRVTGYPLPLPLAGEANVGFVATSGASVIIIDSTVVTDADSIGALAHALGDADITVPASGPETARIFGVTAEAFAAVDGLDAMMHDEYEVADFIRRIGPVASVLMVGGAVAETVERDLPRHDQVVREYERRYGS